MTERPAQDSPKRAKPRPGRGARVALALYFTVAGAFILSSAWQITAAVFGLGGK